MNNKIRQIFAQLIKLSQTNFDGVTLIYEGELGIGTEVFVENADGEVVPAPDGKYGEWTVVGGVIVVPEELEMEEKEEKDNTEELVKENEELKAKIAELEAKIAELEGEKEELSKQALSAEEQIKTIETKEADDKTKNNFSKYFN